jgi:hypothetical protein
MFFAQLQILALRNDIWDLKDTELATLVRLLVVNCELQGPAEGDMDRLARRCGHGRRSTKTFEKTITTLVKLGKVVQTEAGFFAVLAQNAVKHFQDKSKKARENVAKRKDRQPTNAPQSGEEPAVAHQNSAETKPASAATNLDKDECVHPMDGVVKRLNSLAVAYGQPKLEAALMRHEGKEKVQEWTELGLNDDEIAHPVREGLKNKGENPISSWNYFDTQIRRFHAQKARRL